jgi:threonine/homoserine/homoserine lactone efflux protein
MSGWQLFGVIAGAHFLALLSPGPDFVLLVRSAVRNGFARASGVCVGIAAANAVYIGLAISGVSLLQASAGLFLLLKWAGCAYLAWLGWRFLGASAQGAVLAPEPAQRAASGWWQECRTGFLSAILNPKNSLFYASLFSLGFGPETPLLMKLGYGLWMFAVVLVWDLGIARAAAHPGVVGGFMAGVHWFERCTGALLLALAAGIAFGM